MNDLDKILQLADKRTDLIDAIITNIEKQVGKSQSDLRQVTEDWLSGLDVDDDGKIKNTKANKSLILTLERVYNGWIRDSGIQVVKELVIGVNDLQELNNSYFSVFTGNAQLAPLAAKTQDSIQEWLGITQQHSLVKNGYLDTLLKDPKIKNQVRNSTYAAVVGQKGFFEMRRDMNTFIAGNKEQTGALEKYARNFIYDTVATVDRTQSKLMADGLNLTYAIYEGGLVKDSRVFCRQHNGKVYTSDEIAAFDPKEAVPPNYDPFTMLGGYACRHHLSYIPLSIAKTLRPDLLEQK